MHEERFPNVDFQMVSSKGGTNLTLCFLNSNAIHLVIMLRAALDIQYATLSAHGLTPILLEMFTILPPLPCLTILAATTYNKTYFIQTCYNNV